MKEKQVLSKWIHKYKLVLPPDEPLKERFTKFYEWIDKHAQKRLSFDDLPDWIKEILVLEEDLLGLKTEED